jgi:hypothetical protein
MCFFNRKQLKDYFLNFSTFYDRDVLDIDKTFDRACGIFLHENASSSNSLQEVTFEKCQSEPMMVPYGTLQMGRYSLSFECLANLQFGFNICGSVHHALYW